MNGLALCSRSGGLELGLSLACRDYYCVGHVELDAFAAAALVARMEDQTLGPAPVWDDLATFEGERWRGVVDLVSSGFPCQPFSQAGSRLGTEDERWLWPHLERILGEVRPDLVFLENVPGVTVHGGDAVLASLAILGFDAEWDCFRASDVGAPHRRTRWFCLAWRSGGAGRGLDRLREGLVADADRGRREGIGEPQHRALEGAQGREPVGSGGHGGLHGKKLADPRSPRLQGLLETGPAPGTTGRSGLPLFPPRPQDFRWRELLERHPDLDPSLEPEVRGVVDGAASRVDRLRTLGNGCVPLVAAHAFRTLARRALS